MSKGQPIDKKAHRARRRTARHGRVADHEFGEMSEIFAALGDMTRVRIIESLLQGEQSVSQLAKELDISVSAISHQLRRLKDLKILRHHKIGKRVFYALDDAHIAGLFQMALDHVRHSD